MEGEIAKLSEFRLEAIPDAIRPAIAEMLWLLIADLGISASNSQLVAGSKFLHHLLPDLVPPMDRAYTGNFYYLRDLAVKDTTGRLQQNQPRRWHEMFVDFSRFASDWSEDVRAVVTGGWQSSIPKVIDNAIIGFVRTARAK